MRSPQQLLPLLRPLIAVLRFLRLRMLLALSGARNRTRARAEVVTRMSSVRARASSRSFYVQLKRALERIQATLADGLLVV